MDGDHHHRYTGGHKKHDFDKQNASGWKGENRGKKDGHGKGGWGNTDKEGKDAEHKDVDEATKEAEEAETPVPEEPVEEEVNNLTYAEFKAQQAGKGPAKKKGRAPEELKIQGNHEKTQVKTDVVATGHSDLSTKDKYAPTQAPDSLGFNVGPEPEEERREFTGGRGRGRGERGGHRGKPRKPQAAFNAGADDFPALG